MVGVKEKVIFVFVVILQVWTIRRAAQWLDWTPPEWNSELETGTSQHGGEDCIPVLRKGERHSGKLHQIFMNVSASSSDLFHRQFCLWPVGGARGMSDTYLQDGAAAAATAGGAARGFGERHSSDSTWKTNQCAASCYGSAFGVCVHSGQLCRPLDENTQPHAFYVAPRNPPRLPLEALGCYFRVSASLSLAPQMTGLKRHILIMKGQRVWGWCVKGGHGLVQGVETQ